MKKLIKEFAEFINKGNALALAIGVIIGGAFTGIVTAINTHVISPLIGLVLGGYNLAESTELMTPLKWHFDSVTGEKIIDNAIYWGAFIQSVIDFLLTAIVLFAIFKIVGHIHEAAKRSAERARELLMKQEEENTEVVEETPAEEAPVEEVKPSDEVVLLTEIRDLLSKKVNGEE